MRAWITISLLGTCFAWANISLAAKPVANAQRVEVPIYFEKGDSGRPYLEVSVGSSGPLQVGIDTGAGGIRIWEENLKPHDTEKVGIQKKVMYGGGETGLVGEIVLAKVKIGKMALPGKTRVHLVKSHACRDSDSKRCENLPDGSHRGFAGTIGLSTLNHDERKHKANKEDAVINPLIDNGPFSYILITPTNIKPGVLIINPTPEEKARFVKIPLSGNGQHIPMCINRYCFDGMFDTGAGHSKINYQDNKDLKAMGLLLDSDYIVEGTKVPIQFGGRNGITHVFQAGKGMAAFAVKNTGKSSKAMLGINTYHYIDMLYDFDAGIIGIAPKQ